MEVRSKTKLLQCTITDREENRVFISAMQTDGTPIFGEVRRDQLQANLLEVEVLKENGKEALISWPIHCYCLHEDCCGDVFWVSKEFLI